MTTLDDNEGGNFAASALPHGNALPNSAVKSCRAVLRSLTMLLALSKSSRCSIPRCPKINWKQDFHRPRATSRRRRFLAQAQLVAFLGRCLRARARARRPISLLADSRPPLCGGAGPTSTHPSDLPRTGMRSDAATACYAQLKGEMVESLAGIYVELRVGVR